jgi:hypothetical protein
VSDLAAFLAARLDEDEAAAKAGAYLPGKDWDAAVHGSGRERDGVLWDEDHANVIAWFDDELAAAQHAARHDPARVLREVEAKRKILASECAPYPRHAPPMTVTLRLLAAVYADHPDYDEIWRP